MSDHFEWIWEHASFQISELLIENSIGPDKGLHQCGVENIFTSSADGLSRILWILEHTREKVYIQGISLQSFFEPGQLFNAIASLIENVVELQIMVTDSSCEQAKYRSYRENLFSGTHPSLEQYLNSGLHENSDLCGQTQRSIENIRRQLAAIKTRKGKGSQ